jgi:hypothetical protein
MEEKYRGYKECNLNEEQLANFYSKKFDPCAKENEYVILRNSDGEVSINIASKMDNIVD